MPNYVAGPLGPLLDESAFVSPEEAELIRSIERELQPASALGGVLARRVGLLSARLERSARQEAASIAKRRRHAADEFDRDRLAEVDRLMSWIATEPASYVRALRMSPEGIDRMVRGWRAMRVDLNCSIEERWTFTHQQLAENLMGRRPESLPLSRIDALSQAIWNNAKFLEPEEREGRDSKAIRAFARLEIDSIIADQINDLEAHLKTLDLDRIDLDRLEAADRALFDDSPAAVLARKHEAATERGLFRTLRELRQVEDEHQARLAPPPAPPKPTPPPHQAPPRPEPAALASFGQPQPGPAPTPTPAAPARPPSLPVVIRPGEGPMSTERRPR